MYGVGPNPLIKLSHPGPYHHDSTRRWVHLRVGHALPRPSRRVCRRPCSRACSLHLTAAMCEGCLCGCATPLAVMRRCCRTPPWLAPTPTALPYACPSVTKPQGRALVPSAVLSVQPERIPYAERTPAVGECARRRPLARVHPRGAGRFGASCVRGGGCVRGSHASGS